jgi:hypothetical protein
MARSRSECLDGEAAKKGGTRKADGTIDSAMEVSYCRQQKEPPSGPPSGSK